MAHRHEYPDPWGVLSQTRNRFVAFSPDGAIGGMTTTYTSLATAGHVVFGTAVKQSPSIRVTMSHGKPQKLARDARWYPANLYYTGPVVGRGPEHHHTNFSRLNPSTKKAIHAIDFEEPVEVLLDSGDIVVGAMYGRSKNPFTLFVHGLPRRGAYAAARVRPSGWAWGTLAHQLDTRKHRKHMGKLMQSLYFGER